MPGRTRARPMVGGAVVADGRLMDTMNRDPAERNGREPVVGVVVVGHGRIAAEMVGTLTSVVGDVDAVEGVACDPMDDLATVRDRTAAAIERVDRGRGVIVLTDMLGDTASNVSLDLARERTDVEVVAGVNMPMLLKLTTSRMNRKAAELADFIRRYGQDHIFWPTRASS
jgi:mannose PTS system EIIA component